MSLLAQLTSSTNPVVSVGTGLGSVLAIVCSWERNRSILWAVLASLFSWIYVVYFALTRTPAEQK